MSQHGGYGGFSYDPTSGRFGTQYAYGNVQTGDVTLTPQGQANAEEQGYVSPPEEDELSFAEELAIQQEELMAMIGQVFGQQRQFGTRQLSEQLGGMQGAFKEFFSAAGTDPKAAEEIMRRMSEGGSRNIRDFLSGVGQRESQALVGAKQFGISSQLDAEKMANLSQYWQGQLDLGQDRLSMEKFIAELQAQSGGEQNLFGFLGDIGQGVIETAPAWLPFVMDFFAPGSGTAATAAVTAAGVLA